MKAYQTTSPLKSRNVLTELGADVFVPIERRWRRSHHRKAAVCVEAPILSGYLFADGIPFAGDRQTHVTRCVGRVSDAELVQLHIIHGREVGRIEPPAPFRVGESVEIETGPFANQVAKILQIMGNRCVVEVNIFQRANVRITVQSSNIRRRNIPPK